MQYSPSITALVSAAPQKDEQALFIERLARGERAAVADVYDRHHAMVFAFARRLVGCPEAARDLVHDVFITLPKAIRRFEGQSSLSTFLVGIAVNQSRRHIRSAVRKRKAFERLAKEPQNDSPRPDEDAHRRRLARELSRALDELPLNQRVAFVLLEVEERTSREAAEIVGSNEATMRTRLHHAKRKLRVTLEKRGIR